MGVLRMRGRLAALLAAGLAVLALSGANAQEADGRITVAEPDSLQDIAGRVITYFVAGRPIEEARGAPANPYEIDPESLLYALGSFFMTGDYNGTPLREGELSLIATFNTPLGAFAPSARTPAIIPFALMKNGECTAGYFAGFPVPDTAYAVDMGEDICHAAIVEEIVYAQYVAENPAAASEDGDAAGEPEPQVDNGQIPAAVPAGFDPANPLDIDLDVITWAAYNAAYRLAVAEPDFLFLRNGNFAYLRTEIAAELEKEGLPGVTIAMEPAASHDAALGCAPSGTTELRVAFNSAGAGISLVAASARSVSTYRYEPDVSYDLVIKYAGECKREGLARSRPQNVR